MGKKPLLGIVSALCVGLALTGCRDAGVRGDGSLLSKGNSPTYQPRPAFTMNGSNPAPQATGWNGTPATAGKTDNWSTGSPGFNPASAGPTVEGAGMKSLEPMNTSRTPPGIQTTGLTLPPAPPPASPLPDVDPPPGVMNDHPPAAESSSRFPPPSGGAVHTVSGASGRVLPTVPSFTHGSIPDNLPAPPPEPASHEDVLPPPPPPAPTPAPAPAPSGPTQEAPQGDAPPPPPSGPALPPPPPVPGPNG